MSAILSRLMTRLDTAVFARDDAGAFTLLNDPPSWLTVLWPETATTRAGLQPSAAFLFVENFLDRAASFWAKLTEDVLPSGVWTQLSTSGTPFLLEASALQMDGQSILLIERSAKEAYKDIYQRAREQRLEYEQLLEEINKREVLLHCIVHDLSNPLAGIRGSLRLLKTEAEMDEDGAELLRIGLNQAEKMQGRIKGILDTFSNEVAGLVPSLIRADTAPDLAQTSSGVIDALQATAALKGVSLQFEAPTQPEWLVVAESDRLERVVFNLLTNAIRHSPANKDRTVTLRLVEEEGHRRAEVEDEGTGIPEATLPALFTRFGQGEGQQGLAGLGLYFCRMMVESWGGRIGYEPGAAGGARFWFRLPKPIAQTGSTQPSAA